VDPIHAAAAAEHGGGDTAGPPRDADMNRAECERG
jgi:hypothetical protein